MSRGGPSRPWGSDEFLTALVAAAAAVALLSRLSSLWTLAVAWLVERGVLAVESVLWALPAAEGAGLDPARLAIAVGLALLAALGAAGGMRRLRGRSRRDAVRPGSGVGAG